MRMSWVGGIYVRTKEQILIICKANEEGYRNHIYFLMSEGVGALKLKCYPYFWVSEVDRPVIYAHEHCLIYVHTSLSRLVAPQ